MADHVIIDGNNLLYAMHEHAPLPNVGRETLVRIIERWAFQRSDQVTLVFDGPTPRPGLLQQMKSTRIAVQFSERQTADDVIVYMVQQAKQPAKIRVVTSDKAIAKEAAYRRCGCTTSDDFVSELFPAGSGKPPNATPARQEPESPAKPAELSKDEVTDWLDTFGVDDKDEPFDGYDAMRS